MPLQTGNVMQIFLLSFLHSSHLSFLSYWFSFFNPQGICCVVTRKQNCMGKTEKETEREKEKGEKKERGRLKKRE